MTRESFLKRGATGSRSHSHLRSRKQERDLAKKSNPRKSKGLQSGLRAYVTPGSGNGRLKGDVRVVRVCRIEAKTTHHKSFSVTLDMVRKIEQAALGFDEMPVIVVEFNDAGRKVAEVAVVPTYVLDYLTGER